MDGLLCSPEGTPRLEAGPRALLPFVITARTARSEVRIALENVGQWMIIEQVAEF